MGAKDKIIHAFVDMLNEDDSKSQFTKLILFHIRTLPLHLIEGTMDKKLVNHLCKNFLQEKEKTMQEEPHESTVVTNFLWMLHSNVRSIKESPYIIEEIIDYMQMRNKSVPQKLNYFLCCRLLTTCIQIFSCYPPETQHILGKVFELCKNQNDPQIDEKVVFYSKLLRCDSFYKE